VSIFQCAIQGGASHTHACFVANSKTLFGRCTPNYRIFVYTHDSGKFDGKPVEYQGEECQIITDDNVLLAYRGVTLRLETVEPIRDYVLIALFDDTTHDADSETTTSSNTIATASGVVIASMVLKNDLPCQGRVVKVGPGRMGPDGTYTPSPVAPGDNVKFKDYAGNDVTIEGKPYTVVKMVDLLSTYTGE
jgi:chaperonin GroES